MQHFLFGSVLAMREAPRGGEMTNESAVPNES
jgi:hypothetical protein